jgi:hypothetical protein
MLDGRTRLDLLEAGGIKIVNSDGQLLVPHRIVDVQDDAAAEALSLSLNVHRRQLSSKDRRRLIAAEIKADPGQSDRVIAETVKVSPTTVGTVRAEMEAKSEVSKLDTRRDRRGHERPAKRPVRNSPNKPVVRNKDRNQIYRRMKLGDDTVDKLRGSSLDSAHELDELVTLNRGAPAGELTPLVRQLVADAVAGRDVSAVAIAKAVVAKLFAKGNGGDPDDAHSGDHCGDHGDEQAERPAALTLIAAQARIDELAHEVRVRDIRICGLESEIAELKTVAAEACPGDLSAVRLVDLLQHRLERDGINASIQLRKIRALINSKPPTIDLTALPAAGEA